MMVTYNVGIFGFPRCAARTKAGKVLCCRSDSDEGWLGFERWLKGISRHPKVLQSYLVVRVGVDRIHLKKKPEPPQEMEISGLKKKIRSSRGIWIGIP